MIQCGWGRGVAIACFTGIHLSMTSNGHVSDDGWWRWSKRLMPESTLIVMMDPWRAGYGLVPGICQSGAAGGYPRCCILAFSRSLSGILPSWHVLHCGRMSTLSPVMAAQHEVYTVAVMAPISVCWIIRPLLSEVPNGDYLVVTWYLCSRYERQKINFPPSSLRDLTLLGDITSNNEELTVKREAPSVQACYAHVTSGRCPFHMMKFSPGRPC